MRILIDLQAAQSGSRLRGIGRYSVSLAKAMLTAGTKHEFFLLLSGVMPESISDIRDEFDDLLPRQNIFVWHAQGPTDWLSEENASRRRMAELTREACIAYVAPDVVHVTSPMDGFSDNAIFTLGAFGWRPATATTFYDAIPLVQSHVYLDPYPEFESMYRARLNAVAKADLLLAISEHAREEAITYLKTDPIRTVNILADADAHFKRVSVDDEAEEELRRKFGIRDAFIMYSGATDERKNHLRLIAAYSKLSAVLRARYQLVFVGRTHPVHAHKFRHYANALQVDETEFVMTNGVTDDELLYLYNLCALFVMPSWHEGFGLPALEAMRCGAPVIGANTSSIPEVLDDPTALFDPFSAASIALKMTEVLSSDKLRQTLSERAMRRAEAFSWAASAQRALAAFERLPAGSSRPFSGSIIEALIAKVGKELPRTASEAELRVVARDIDRTFVERRRRHLLIDVSELIRNDAGTGIQRVVKQILAALIGSPPVELLIVPVYAVHESGWYRYARQYAKAVLSLTGSFFEGEDSSVELQAGDVFLGLDLHYRKPPREMNISDRMRAVGGYSYFVVYDLLPILMPQHFPGGAPARHHDWLLGVANSDGALCISKAVADEFITWLPGSGTPRESIRVGWFHLGSDMAAGSKLATGQGLDPVLHEMEQRPSFVMVGTLEPRKGHVQTLIAFDELWDEDADVNLVIVGKYGWNVDLQAELIRTNRLLGKRLFWIKSASDELLTQIYDRAACLIAASEGEGFGLPLVEAAKRGVDIIARDLPVFREVATGRVSFFKGRNGDVIAKAVRQWVARNGPRGGHDAGERAPLTWQESKDQLLRCVTGGHWYRKVSTSGDKQFCGADFRFQSTVGRREATSLRSTYSPGFLFYGHYLKLEPGRYVAELDVTFFASGNICADVMIRRGAAMLVEAQLDTPPQGDATIELLFDVAEQAADVEVRMVVDAAAGVELHSLNVKWLGRTLSNELPMPPGRLIDAGRPE